MSTTKITIDIRPSLILGTNFRGIGRYIQNLLALKDNPLLRFYPPESSWLYHLYFSTNHLATKLQQPFFFKLLRYSQLSLIQVNNLLLKANSKNNLYHFTDIHLSPIVPPKTPFIISLYDIIPLLYPKRYLKKGLYNKYIYLKNIQTYSHQALKILTISKNSRKLISHQLRLPEDKIEVIYPAIKPIFFKTKTTPSPIQGQYLLYVGGVDFRKNISTLIKAFVIIKRNGLAKYLIMVSSDMLSRHNQESLSIWRLIKNLNLESSVIIKANLSDQDLANLYHHAECLVMPSLNEGFGYPVAEAMASGCPVLASEIEVIKEITKQIAIYFNPNQERSIVRAYLQLINNKQKKLKLIQEGKKRAKKFSLNRFKEEMNQFYKELANQLQSNHG